METIEKNKFLNELSNAYNLYREKNYEKAFDILYKIINYTNHLENNNDKFNFFQTLGVCCSKTEKNELAIKYFEKALEYNNKSSYIYNMLGFLYFNKDNDKSVYYYIEGMKIKPDIGNFTYIITSMIRSAQYDQKQIKETFEKYTDIFRKDILNDKLPFEYSDYKQKGKIKVGYISSNVYSHAMMCFMLPIFKNHNLDKFDINIYSLSKKEDSVTETIKNHGITITNCSDMTPYQIAEVIHKDEIDILVDISGYTDNTIWKVSFFKPAPVIIQYLGFVGTMGIKDIDYILCDEFTIPKDSAQLYTEKPLYIKCGMNRFCFNSEKQELPDITELPCLNNGFITFGSYNCYSKINNYTIDLWSKILQRFENSKLLIYRTQLKDIHIERFKKRFLLNNIDLNRIIFDNTATKPNHFASYLKCDIALDPFPYSGLTIVIEQTLMGIPVISYRGSTFSSTGASRVNKVLNLDELIANSEEEYINNAISLAKDIEKLKYYRSNLRNIILNSQLFNGYKEYTQEIEGLYEEVLEKEKEKHFIE